VLLPDLLKNTEDRETWITRLEKGEDAIPAYGSVLTRPQLEALVDFLLAVRDGALPQPDDIFQLSRDTPGNYRLQPGGDAARGQAYYAQTCAHCHGADGTAFLLDGGEHSLGSLMRVEGYATWLKILSGQPGSDMHAQVPEGATREQLTQIVRDLDAALCDRTRFPRGNASHADVPDGDPRCGEYLK
jgi:mono/diheme cytochrome c family protein